ncbi:unnamed protein product [Cyprideis torosa]|uniref:Uncharacterized protein n=1 Tax=Cyprideis torosa TaxID=163714 RepID=A0A7R8ZIR3_9CRUS|nr:unnamed protein product [Cyprideis torosa]CAG0886783.1 unnamed protein product [Cyprideis torosa]
MPVERGVPQLKIHAPCPTPVERMPAAESSVNEPSATVQLAWRAPLVPPRGARGCLRNCLPNSLCTNGKCRPVCAGSSEVQRGGMCVTETPTVAREGPAWTLPAGMPTGREHRAYEACVENQCLSARGPLGCQDLDECASDQPPPRELQVPVPRRNRRGPHREGLPSAARVCL